jgi:hypothetical protein
VGGLMRLDNLLEKRWSRNATLVQGLVALDIIEELSFELDRMVAVMAEAGLPAPIFSNNGDTFVVSLSGAGARLPGGPAKNHIMPGTDPRGSSRQLARRTRQAWAWTIYGGGKPYCGISVVGGRHSRLRIETRGRQQGPAITRGCHLRCRVFPQSEQATLVPLD